MNRAASRAVHLVYRNVSGPEVLQSGSRTRLIGTLTAASKLKQPPEYSLQPSSTRRITVLGSAATVTVVS